MHWVEIKLHILYKENKHLGLIIFLKYEYISQIIKLKFNNWTECDKDHTSIISDVTRNIRVIVYIDYRALRTE